MGRYMNIPFHWVADNDPAKRKRDRKEFATQEAAEEYEAQIEIENARKAQQTPISQPGDKIFKTSDEAQNYIQQLKGGLSQNQKPALMGFNSVKEMTKPGGVIGSTQAGKDAFAYETQQEQTQQQSEKTIKVAQGLQQYADKHGTEATRDWINMLANLGLIDEGIKEGIKLNEAIQKEKEAGQKFGMDMAKQKDQQEYGFELQDKKDTAAKERAQIMAQNQYGLENLRSQNRLKEKDRNDTEVGSKTFQQESSLRKEYNSLSKDYSTVRDSYSRVITSSKNPSAAGDLSMIFNYMKMLDPGSVVRESEYASAENARGVPESIRNTYNKVMDGKILSPKQREDFLSRAREIYKTTENTQQQLLKQYRENAISYGIDPDRVTGSIVVSAYGGAEENKTQPQQTSTVDDKIEQLKELARSGDTTAQNYLKRKGINW